MSKPKRTLVNAASIFGAAEKFNPDMAAWKRIETAFGKPLRASGRYQLSAIATSYAMQRAREIDPPLLAAAVAQIVAIEKAAADLEAALQAVTTAPVSVRLPGLFLAARAKADRGGDPECLEVNLETMRRAAGSFARAAPQVRQMLQSDIENGSGGGSFSFLISALADFAEARGVKVTARGDYEKISPFVSFALAINAALPAPYRRESKSDEAFSRAVSDVFTARVKNTGC